MSLLSQQRIDSVRIGVAADIAPAARALHAIALECGMRAAPAHDIADKHTPVDADGNVLALHVFGWNEETKVWWRNSRIALDSPITTACRFESEPFWVNAEGFRTRQPNAYLDAIAINNFESRAMTRAVTLAVGARARYARDASAPRRRAAARWRSRAAVSLATGYQLAGELVCR